MSTRSSCKVNIPVDGIVRGIEAEASRKALKVCHVFRNQVVKNLTGKRSGRKYRVPGTKREYTASAPGEYPAVMTGQLRASIKFLVQMAPGNVFAIVGSNVLHGIYLEGSQEAPGIRPWLWRSYLEVKEKIEAICREPWDIK